MWQAPLAWTAPTIVSCFASPAAASTPSVQPSYVTAGTPESTNGAAAKIIGLPASGAFYLLITVADHDNTGMTGPPAPWTRLVNEAGDANGPTISVWWARASAVGGTAPTVQNTQGGFSGVVISFNGGSSAVAGGVTGATIPASTTSGSFPVAGFTTTANSRFVMLGGVEGAAGKDSSPTPPFWSVTNGTTAILVTPASFSVPDVYVAQFPTATGTNTAQTASFSQLKANNGIGYVGLQVAVLP